MIGYGSLMVAGSQAFVSFGRVAILGEVTCVAAALVSLPALLMWMDRRRAVETARGSGQDFESRVIAERFYPLFFVFFASSTL